MAADPRIGTELAGDRILAEMGRGALGFAALRARSGSIRTPGTLALARALEISADREALGEASEALVAAFVGEGVKVRSIAPGKASLEEVFTALTADPASRGSGCF